MRSPVDATTAGNTAALKVGRLLEIRADGGYQTAADVDAMFEQIRRAMKELPPGSPHIVVADWRSCPVLSDEAAERLAISIAQTNPGLLRSAAITRDTAPSAVLHFLRVIREADHPDRKLFRNARELVRWLDEVATPAESRRLREFLACW